MSVSEKLTMVLSLLPSSFSSLLQTMVKGQNRQYLKRLTKTCVTIVLPQAVALSSSSLPCFIPELQHRPIMTTVAAVEASIQAPPRRSKRIRGVALASQLETSIPTLSPSKFQHTSHRKASTKTSSPTKSEKPKKKKKKDTAKDDNDAPTCLPRTREMALKQINSSVEVVGIDEAGRGPLAGPVVAAAIIAPSNLAGVIDSKKITKEEDREALYEQLIAMENVKWAVAVMDAPRIDEINILQATLEGMRLATTAVLSSHAVESQQKRAKASSEHTGSYVVCSDSCDAVIEPANGYALVDGNRLPKEMPCEAETMVKGDSKEFAIAAASILAKVTRDRLMHEYDLLYPQYNLKQHKGYPTTAHMAVVKKCGASPIHRRSFAPLKHMTLDEDGKIVTVDAK